MVRAWIMDNDDSVDQRSEHKRNPHVEVSIEELKSKTGVLYCRVDPEREVDKLELIKKERGYNYQDIIEISPEKLPNYDQTLKTFYKEHLHTDEEIRFFLEGSAYMDVRHPNEDWIRISLEAGDLIILPSGIYHRFTLDTKNYVKAMRLFENEPVWTPHFRPADDMDARKQYMQQVEKGSFEQAPNLM